MPCFIDFGGGRAFVGRLVPQEAIPKDILVVGENGVKYRSSVAVSLFRYTQDENGGSHTQHGFAPNRFDERRCKWNSRISEERDMSECYIHVETKSGTAADCLVDCI